MIVGTDTIDGKVCLVIEYTVEKVKIKSWMWKDRGWPIRMEMATEGITTIAEVNNIEFVDIPDSTFELPPGVQIKETPG